MNANIETMPVCAPSDRTVDWHSIDWSQCHENVRKLQARIVKATKEGRWGKVKALQRLLTTSFYGKALAVKRVTSNKGRNTPELMEKSGHLRRPNRKACCPSGVAGTILRP